MNNLMTASPAAGEILSVDSDGQPSLPLARPAMPRTRTSAELRQIYADAAEADDKRRKRTNRLVAAFWDVHMPPRFAADPGVELDETGPSGFPFRWPFDATDAAEVFASWPISWQRRSIYAHLHGWQGSRLRRLACFAIALADQKDAALCGSQGA